MSGETIFYFKGCFLNNFTLILLISSVDLDIVSIVAPIGIFFGRIANFINSELYGIESNLPWAVKFIQIDDLYRHPSQLYEALFEGLILLVILLYFRKKGFMKIPGLISGLFLIFYSTFRFAVEFFSCLLYTSPSPRDRQKSRMPSYA